MYGAILGDIIGSPYEFDRGDKTKDFELFGEDAFFTDDTVMTVAVAEALMDVGRDAAPDEICEAVRASMLKWGRAYPYAGYGTRFLEWLDREDPEPYNSFGNGSAMRVSAAGWLYDSLDRTREVARATAEPTHNHPEGIKGAEAVASAIYLARTGSSKDDIKEYITEEFGYDLTRTCDEIRPGYHHVESCQESVPEAITAFLEGRDFEDVIRTAISLGGDTDTLAAIAGSIAESYFGIPILLVMECKERVAEDILEVLERFEEETINTPPADNRPDPLEGNDQIEKAIETMYQDPTELNLSYLLFALSKRMSEGGSFLVPIEVPEDLFDEYDRESAAAGEPVPMEEVHLKMRMVEDQNGNTWLTAFTSDAESDKGEGGFVTPFSIEEFLRFVLDSDGVDGALINPWGQPFSLPNHLIQLLFAPEEG